MKKAYLVLAFALGGALTLLGETLLRPLPVQAQSHSVQIQSPSVKAPSERVQWQYLIGSPPMTTKQLNALGKDGWEIAAYANDDIIFNRHG